MTTVDDEIKNQLERYIARLLENAAALEKKLAETRAKIKSAEETLHGLRGAHGSGQGIASKGWGCAVEDIKDSKSIRDALVTMALLNDGVLKPTPAARLVMEAGLTEGKVLANVAAGVYARLKDRPEWLRVGRGEFRYLAEADNTSRY